jgi:hypothetical protein
MGGYADEYPDGICLMAKEQNSMLISDWTDMAPMAKYAVGSTAALYEELVYIVEYTLPWHSTEGIP